MLLPIFRTRTAESVISKLPFRESRSRRAISHLQKRAELGAKCATNASPTNHEARGARRNELRTHLRTSLRKTESEMAEPGVLPGCNGDKELNLKIGAQYLRAAALSGRENWLQPTALICVP